MGRRGGYRTGLIERKPGQTPVLLKAHIRQRNRQQVVRPPVHLFRPGERDYVRMDPLNPVVVVNYVKTIGSVDLFDDAPVGGHREAVLLTCRNTRKSFGRGQTHEV